MVFDSFIAVLKMRGRSNHFSKVIFLIYQQSHTVYTQYKQKYMNHRKEIQYNQKLTAIQSKFTLICKKYHQITQELRVKDQTIARMTSEINSLSSKLEKANDTIDEMKKQLNKKQLLQKTYYLRHKANLQSNELIESESLPSKNFISRLKDPKMQVYSEVPNQKLSQQSIAPEESRIKYKHIRFGSNQEVSAKLRNNFNTPITSTAINTKNEDDLASSKPLNRIKSVQLMKIDGEGDSPSIKTLQKIWQERDSQICKMDELFESLTNKLKDYQQ